MKDNDWFFRDDDIFGEALHRRTEELYRIPDSIPDENGLIQCPLLPLRDLVVYPHMVSPVFLSQKIALAAVEESQLRNQTVIALTLRDPEIEKPAPEDFFSVGVEMAVGRLLTMPDNSSSALVQGRRRVEVVKFVKKKSYMAVIARPVYDVQEINQEIEALMRTVREMFQKCVQLDRSLPEETYLYALNIEDPGWLADMIVTAVAPPLDVRQDLLAVIDPFERLEHVINLLAREADVLELEDKIHARAQSEVDRTQREFYLREQMKVIQTELGENDLWTQEMIELQTRVETAELPEEVQVRCLKEVNRLGQMPPMSPEVGIIRTYIEWFLELPWKEFTEDNLDVLHAEETLESQHYGLPRAKDRVLEYIAVRSLGPKKLRQPILCFVGPPGTGKTSLGRSIADALGRKFVRLSLGGVRDEAEIRGHRRTYIGALPGRILQTMRRAGTINPLFMLDEIDKLGQDFRGDPSSALLEVLDPEQNFSFSDHYLELPYDLSKVMFITTANTSLSIPPALLDRMEVIEFPGYIEEEKIEIAKRFLVPRQAEENGLELDEVKFPELTLKRIIHEYTYEAGVRNLEREIGRTLRKIARLKAEKKKIPSRVNASSLERFLGPPQYFNLEAEEKDEIGVATAIAWTEGGGEIMPVEVLLVEGKGNLQITGQIGSVMQESAQAALTYLKSRVDILKIDPEYFEQIDIHIHVPEGGIPKDGPSAGITICTALVSGFTRRPVFRDIGMSGEITLRGRILPVGGIREKILAAHRAGLKKVLIPEKNKKDLVEISRRVQREMDIIQVSHMDQVLEIAIGPITAPKPSSQKTGKTARKTHDQNKTKNAASDAGRGSPSIQSGA